MTPNRPGLWRGFTLDTPEDEIRARFTEIYGRPPEIIETAGPLLLAGPIPVPPAPPKETPK